MVDLGTSTAAISVGGYTGSASVAVVEQWNGSSWTEVGDLNDERYNINGFGTSTAAIAAGGVDNLDKVESWDNSSWTEIAELNTDRGGGGSSGIQTDGMIYGGAPGSKADTETWNGSSWTEVANLATARRLVGSTDGTNSSTAAIFGGMVPPGTAATEEWTLSHAFKKVTTS